jgi:hypothetical protein
VAWKIVVMTAARYERVVGRPQADLRRAFNGGRPPGLRSTGTFFQKKIASASDRSQIASIWGIRAGQRLKNPWRFRHDRRAGERLVSSGRSTFRGFQQPVPRSVPLPPRCGVSCSPAAGCGEKRFLKPLAFSESPSAEKGQDGFFRVMPSPLDAARSDS